MSNIDVFALVCEFIDSEVSEKELTYEIVSRKKELDFNDWAIVHCELNGKITKLDELSSSMMVATANSFEEWSDVYFYIESRDTKDLAIIEMKKIGDIDDWLDLLFGDHGPYEPEKTREEIIRELLKNPGLDVLIGEDYGINDWCCHYDKHSKDLPDLTKDLAGKVHTSLESWWATYDLYEYDKKARSIILAEMKKIDNQKGWYDIFSETRRKMEDYGEEGELYNTAIEMEPKFEMSYYRFATKKS